MFRAHWQICSKACLVKSKYFLNIIIREDIALVADLGRYLEQIRFMAPTHQATEIRKMLARAFHLGMKVERSSNMHMGDYPLFAYLSQPFLKKTHSGHRSDSWWTGNCREGFGWIIIFAVCISFAGHLFVCLQYPCIIKTYFWNGNVLGKVWTFDSYSSFNIQD